MLQKASLIIKGMLLTSAMVIPGVSVATMACMLGIYERLIFITNDLFSVKIPNKKNLSFLFFLGIGGIIFLTSTIKYIPVLVYGYPQILFPFLFGMSISVILVSSVTLQQKIYTFFIAAACILLLYPIKLAFIPESTVLTNISSENYSSTKLILWATFAMICSLFPGLSGSLVLVISGFWGILYQSLLNMVSGAITLLDIQLWINFCIGIFCGGLITSKLLTYCYRLKSNWIHLLTNVISITAMFFLFTSIQEIPKKLTEVSFFFVVGISSLQLTRYIFNSLEYSSKF